MKSTYRALVLIVGIWVACVPSRVPERAASPTSRQGRPFEQPAPREPMPAPLAKDESEKDPWAGRTDLIQAPPRPQPVPIRLPGIEQFTLPSGLKVLVVESHDLPFASFHLAVPAGEAEEPLKKRSIARIAADLLTKGTKKRTAEQIAEEIDFVGGSLLVTVDYENTMVTCQVLAKDLGTCLALLPDVVINATFPEKEIPGARERIIREIREVRDNASALASEHFERLLWGDAHARGRPRTIDAVSAVIRKDLISWHQGYFSPSGATLAVAGDVDPRALKIELTKAFAGWKIGRKVATKPVVGQPRVEGLKVRLVDKPDQTQSHILLGHLGIAHGDPDFFPTLLMNFSLGGGGFSSRLMSVIRAEGGKSYHASSQFEVLKTRGTFRAEAATRTPETVTTLKLLLGELRSMRDSGPTATELEDAKSSLVGNYPLRFQSAFDVAMEVLRAALHGFGEDYVRNLPLQVASVTPSEAMAAARTRLDPENLVVVIVGRGEEVEPQLKQAGIAYEKVGYLDPVARRPPSEVIAPHRATEGRVVLDEALKAKGGSAALREIRDIVVKGSIKITTRDESLEGDMTRTFLVREDKLKLEVLIRRYGALVTLSVAPAGAWQAVGTGPSIQLPQELAQDEVARLWRDRDLILLRHLEPGTLVEWLGKELVNGREYDAVRVSKTEGGLDTKLLIDATTRLVFRMEYKESSGLAREEYGDYRVVSGIQFPFTQRIVRGGQEATVTVAEILLNTDVRSEELSKEVEPK
ncbi:MAG: insulinase family protein [Deltaproteobacteria bacterium]|nr:insulinase family protein [Deltaproteobacteria bacterium]